MINVVPQSDYETKCAGRSALRNSVSPRNGVCASLKTYLGRFVREKDVQLFLDITHTPAPRSPADLDLTVLAPAYMLSEMRAGFQIGAILFLPFLVIDMVTASVTTSIGMMQLPPVVISTPLKILLFVVADGWNLVVGSMLKSFH